MKTPPSPPQAATAIPETNPGNLATTAQALLHEDDANDFPTPPTESTKPSSIAARKHSDNSETTIRSPSHPDSSPSPSPTTATSTSPTTPTDAASVSAPDQETAEDEEEVKKNKKAAVAEQEKKPYSAFTGREKWLIVVTCSIAGIFSPVSSTILAPSLPILAREFGETTEKINLTMTLYLVFQALSPSIWGSLSDTLGRRPIYLLTLLIYLAACIGLALTPTSTFGLLLFLRCLQSTGGSAVIAIGSGCIADVATPGERGKFIGVFNAISMIGPAFGPVLGGILSYAINWRWIFWILAILSGATVVVLFFIFPETLRSIVGDGSLTPPMINSRPLQFIARRKAEKQPLDKASKMPLEYQNEGSRAPAKKFDPFSSFKMLFFPDVLMMLVFGSSIYVIFYWVLTTYSTLLSEIYGYNDIQIGLCYLANGGGSAISAIVLGRFLDWDFKRAKAKAGFEGTNHTSLEGFAIERVRMRSLPYALTAFLAATIGFGWSLQARTSVAVSIVMNVFIGAGNSVCMSVVTILMVDLFPGNGGAITASFNLVRCISAAALIPAADPLIRSVGVGWSYVIISGLTIICIPLPLIIIKKGPEWRRQRAVGVAKKEAKRAAKQEEKAAKSKEVK